MLRGALAVRLHLHYRTAQTQRCVLHAESRHEPTAPHVGTGVFCDGNELRLSCTLSVPHLSRLSEFFHSLWRGTTRAAPWRRRSCLAAGARALA